MARAVDESRTARSARRGRSIGKIESSRDGFGSPLREYVVCDMGAFDDAAAVRTREPDASRELAILLDGSRDSLFTIALEIESRADFTWSTDLAVAS
jgi:hypothetical protein